MREAVALIAEVLTNISSEQAIAGVRQRVAALTARYPLYTWKLETRKLETRKLDPVRA